ILTIYLLTGSASKGADAVSGKAAEPVALIEGGAVEAVVPDSDEGSGDNSSVGQHVPTGSDHRTAVGEDRFIEGMNALSSPDDLNHLLDLCGNLEQSLKTFCVKLVGLPTLVQRLMRLRDHWHLLSK
ncbi:hypothetical protein ACLOJK_038365, partial [Asimina triloba]